jgi:hypothetical protein
MDDPWRSTSFSTQKVYHETLYYCIAAFFLLGIAVLASIYPLFDEECAQGYYEFTGENLDEADGKNFFGFVEDNICGKCEHSNCESCQES